MLAPDVGLGFSKGEEGPLYISTSCSLDSTLRYSRKVWSVDLGQSYLLGIGALAHLALPELAVR